MEEDDRVVSGGIGEYMEEPRIQVVNTYFTNAYYVPTIVPGTRLWEKG